MTRKRKQNQRIKPTRPSPPWQRRIAVSFVFLLVVMSVAALILDQLLRPDVFSVERVHYFGTFERVQPSELEHVVNPTVGGNLLALDLERVENVASAIPWVESVDVQRRLPNALRVTVTEQRLIARWLPGGWINRLGDVVTLPIDPAKHSAVVEAGAQRGESAPATGQLPVTNRQSTSITTLPVLSGPAGSSAMVLTRYRRWGALLAGEGMRLVKLELTEGRMWSAQVVISDLVGSNGAQAVLDLVIGQHQPEQRLARFARIFRSALDVRLADVAQVDLRYPNGFAVQWRASSQQPNPESNPGKGAKQA